jgi:hypothetical protein
VGVSLGVATSIAIWGVIYGLNRWFSCWHHMSLA